MLSPVGASHHVVMVQPVIGQQSARRRREKAWAVSSWHVGLAGVLVALVLLQAVIAGQALFAGWSIELHGWLGNASFVLGLVLLVMAMRSGARGAVALAGALTIAMFMQIGLGYAGRTALGAASWHVPLGVTIFGLAVANASLLYTSARVSTGDAAPNLSGSPSGCSA